MFRSRGTSLKGPPSGAVRYRSHELACTSHAGNTPHTPAPDIFRPRTPRLAAPPTKTPALFPEFWPANPHTATVAGSLLLSFHEPASSLPLRTSTPPASSASPPPAPAPSAPTIPRPSGPLSRPLPGR